MTMSAIGRAKKALRAPAVILAEIAVFAVICLAGAVFPQEGSAAAKELQQFGQSWPGLRALGFAHIFHGPVFAAAALITAISLAIIVWEQWKRVGHGWTQKLTLAQFRSAPLQAEFERRITSGPGNADSPVRVWTERRLGLAGSALFHTGLLAIMVAGACRAYFGADAAIDVMEGETVAAGSTSWVAQWPGVFARDFGLKTPLRLEGVSATRYASGGLRDYRATLSTTGAGALRTTQVAVNHDLNAPGGRVYLGSEFGPAALIEWHRANAADLHLAAFLAQASEGRYEAALPGPDGITAFLRAELDEAGSRPEQIEARVMKDGALLCAAELRVGASLALPNGDRLVLRQTPFWARLRGSRDPAFWLAYVGFALVTAGAAAIFMLVRVDFCVSVRRLHDKELVFVALRPQRFAPLFQERFERLIAELGGAPDRCAVGREVRLSAGLAPQRAVSESIGAVVPIARGALLLALVLLLNGCQGSVREEARHLVGRYNQVVAEAYRRGDVKLIDPVVGDKEGRKITGLIGVRTDLGLTLDSELLALEILRAEKSGHEFQVWTKERWRYRDRKIGSGVQVGEESVDDYEMCYLFRYDGRAWLAEELRFNSPPIVGRKTSTWVAQRTPEQAPGSVGPILKGGQP